MRHTSDDVDHVDYVHDVHVDRVGHGYVVHVDVDGDDDERNYHEHHHISEVGTSFLSCLSNNACGYDAHVDVFDHAHDDGDDERNYHDCHHIHFCGYVV